VLINCPRKIYMAATIVLGSLFLSSCTVGPDYLRPALPDIKKFSHQESVSVEHPQPSDYRFWQSFNDATLTQLVDATLKHNHNIRIAYANYQKANALLRGARFEKIPIPTASGEAGSIRESKDQANGADRRHENYQADIGVVWELDFFGRIQRTIEAQRGETQARAGDLAAMQVAVVGELARNYFQLRGLQEQLRIVRSNVQNQKRTVRMLRLRYEAGQGTSFDVDRGLVLLESTQARTPALEVDIAVLTHRIAVLTGNIPESMETKLDIIGEFKTTDAPDIALDTPGELLRRRPDVAAAERRLASASALVGVETADLFPRFTLAALIGVQSFNAGSLFQADSATRAITLGMGGPFLNIGQVRARIAAANADMEASLALYERTVLEALEETENTLIRISRIKQELDHLQQATEASSRAAKAAQAHFDNGTIDVLEVLDAEYNHLQAQNDYVLGWTRYMQFHISLYEIMAGGWPQDLPKREINDKSL